MTQVRVTRTVEGFGGFAKQHEQIEKVSAHHGNLWEPLLYGQIGRDRAVMSGPAENNCPPPPASARPPDPRPGRHHNATGRRS